MKKTLKIEISSIILELNMNNTILFEKAKKEWADFLTGKNPDGQINLDVKIIKTNDHKDFLKEQFVPENVQYENDKYISRNKYNKGEYDFIQKIGSAELITNDNYSLVPLTNLLKNIYSIFLLKQKKLLMHGCGIINNEKGYLFMGEAGSGKSTIAKKNSEKKILSDESVIIDLEESTVTSTMLGGEFPAKKEEKHSLHKMIEIKKGNKLEEKELTGSQKIYAIMRNILPFMVFGRGSEEIFKQCLNITTKIPDNIEVSKLSSRKQDNIWKVLK